MSRGDAGSGESLRRDVRRQLSLEQSDLVFQVELALLETLKLELVLDGISAKAGDDVIEVSVLEVQLIDTLPEHFTVGRMYHWHAPHTDLARSV